MVSLFNALISFSNWMRFFSSYSFCWCDHSRMRLASYLQKANFYYFCWSFLSTWVYFILNYDTQFRVLYLFVRRYSQTMGLQRMGSVYRFFMRYRKLGSIKFFFFLFAQVIDQLIGYSFLDFLARMLPVPKSKVHFSQQPFLLLIQMPVNILEKTVNSSYLSLLSNLLLDLGKAQKNEQKTDWARVLKYSLKKMPFYFLSLMDRNRLMQFLEILFSSQFSEYEYFPVWKNLQMEYQKQSDTRALFSQKFKYLVHFSMVFSLLLYLFCSFQICLKQEVLKELITFATILLNSTVEGRGLQVLSEENQVGGTESSTMQTWNFLVAERNTFSLVCLTYVIRVLYYGGAKDLWLGGKYLKVGYLVGSIGRYLREENKVGGFTGRDK